MRSISVWAFPLTVISMILTGCSSTRPQLLPVTGGKPQLEPQAAGLPAGQYRARSAPNMVRLVVHEDRSYELLLDGDILDSGRFDVNGTRVLVDSYLCGKEGNKPAAYDWRFDDEGGLAFGEIESDSCPERQQYLTEVYVPILALADSMADREVAKRQLP